MLSRVTAVALFSGDMSRSTILTLVLLLDIRLPEAAAAGDWEAVRQMLRELGPGCINSRDSGGSGILHWAIRAGKTPFVKVCIVSTWVKPE